MRGVLGLALATGTVMVAGYVDLLLSDSSRQRLDRSTQLMLTWLLGVDCWPEGD
jgi:hypothetical protein